jgi:hypothetical protein
MTRINMNRNILRASDSGDRFGNLCLCDQIGSLNSLCEATIEPERAAKICCHHGHDIQVAATRAAASFNPHSQPA